MDKEFIKKVNKNGIVIRDGVERLGKYFVRTVKGKTYTLFLDNMVLLPGRVPTGKFKRVKECCKECYTCKYIKVPILRDPTEKEVKKQQKETVKYILGIFKKHESKVF